MFNDNVKIINAGLKFLIKAPTQKANIKILGYLIYVFT